MSLHLIGLVGQGDVSVLAQPSVAGRQQWLELETLCRCRHLHQFGKGVVTVLGMAWHFHCMLSPCSSVSSIACDADPRLAKTSKGGIALGSVSVMTASGHNGDGA